MKKFTSLILILCLVFNFIPVFSQETDTYYGKPQFYNILNSITFSDMEYLPVDHWSNTAVYTMSVLNIIKGSGNKFNPFNTATRSEALAVLFRAAGLEGEAGQMLKVVLDQKKQNPNLYNNIDAWADGYLRLAIEKDLINIDEYMSAMDRWYDKTNSHLFAKDQPVTRMEIARWMVILFKIPMSEKENVILDYEDYKDISSENRLYMETAVKNGLLKGSDGKLMPNETLTREQLAQMFYNILDILLQFQGITKTSGQIDDINIETTNSTGKISNSITMKIGQKTLCSKRTYDLDGEAVSNNINYENEYTDFPVIWSKGSPTDTSTLKKTDKIVIYTKDNNVLFISKSDNTSEFVYNENEYTESKVYTGKLFLVDTIEQVIIIKNDESFIEIPYLSNVEFYNRHKLIPIDEVNLNWIDNEVYMFSVIKKSGGIDRIYKVQMLK